MSELSEAERALITQVAMRERWRDPRHPPAQAPGPRSLPEQAAISRYQSALSGGRAPNLARRRRITLIVLIAACIAGVIACLLVSVTQTLFGLIGGAIFGLWSWRRARRRQAA